MTKDNKTQHSATGGKKESQNIGKCEPECDNIRQSETEVNKTRQRETKSFPSPQPASRAPESPEKIRRMLSQTQLAQNTRKRKNNYTLYSYLLLGDGTPPEYHIFLAGFW